MNSLAPRARLMVNGGHASLHAFAIKS